MQLERTFHIPILVLLLTACAVTGQAQPLLTTRALMYDQGPDPYFPPQGCRQVEIWRYIPGAKFQSGLDLRIERREYDRDGRLVSWTRYNTVSGEMIWKKTVEFNEKGERTAQRLQMRGEGIDLRFTYQHAYDSTGRLIRSSAIGDGGLEMARLEFGEDGKLFYTEQPRSPELLRQVLYGPDGRTLATYFAQKDQRQTYTYDSLQYLTEVRHESPEGHYFTRFENVYDASGRMVKQVEKVGNNATVRYFEYDGRGNLILKYDGNRQPLEHRTYFPDGTLRDMLVIDPDGTNREVLRYSYLYYSTEK